MTAPNLKSPTLVTGKTYANPLNSELPELVANPADSGQVYKINTIVVSSLSPDTPTTITINFMRFGSAAKSICYNKEIAPLTTYELINRNTAFYLEEGDSIASIVFDNFMADVLISYEIIGEPYTPPA